MAETEHTPSESAEQKPAVEHSEAPVSDFLAAKEATATGETYVPSDEELKLRNRRSRAIAAGVVLFMVLVFSITVLRLAAAAGSA